MKWLKNRESGQTLIMALILLAVGSLLVVPLLNQSFTNLRYHQSIECRTLNSYTADSGVEYVLAKLYGNPGIYTGTPLQESFTLNNRTVNVTGEYQGSGIFKATSTASGGGCGRATITAYINLGAGSFTYVIAAKTSISLDNTAVDSLPYSGDGDIRSNGNIDLGGNVLVNGDATAVGIITGQDRVMGTPLEGASPIQFPGDYSGLYKTMAKEGDTYNESVTLHGGTIYFGPAHIVGDLTVEPNTTVILEGTVYVTGTITVNNGRFEGEQNIAAEGNIAINGGSIASSVIPILTSVNGDITLQGPLVNAVVYAPNGTVTLSNIQLYGAIGGNTVNVSKALITYTQELQGREDLPGGLLYTISYSYD